MVRACPGSQSMLGVVTDQADGDGGAQLLSGQVTQHAGEGQGVQGGPAAHSD